MIFRCLLMLFLGATAFAYSPSAGEILTQMETALRRAEPVQVKVLREDAQGRVLEELSLKIPGPPGGQEQGILDLSFAALTQPLEGLSRVIPAVTSASSQVSLGRLNGHVCYVLGEGAEKLWINKGSLLPEKIEVHSPDRLGTTYLYLDMVMLSENVSYPSRTEVWREGDLVLVERLLSAPEADPEP